MYQVAASQRSRFEFQSSPNPPAMESPMKARRFLLQRRIFVRSAVCLLPALACAVPALAQAPWLPQPFAILASDRSLADLDGDGKLDMVSTLGSSGLVLVSRGDGLGGFGPYTPYSIGNWIKLNGRVRCADFDLDGDIDVATAERIEWGDGLGGLSNHVVIPWPFTWSSSGTFEVGDVDATGTPDLVAKNGASLHALPLLAAGAFGAIVGSPGATTGFSFALFDSNQDGLLDLLSSTDGAASPGVYVSQGLGGAAFSTAVAVIQAPDLELVAAGDLDLDGQDDLCAFDGGQNALKVWKKQGGVFVPAQSVPSSILDCDQLAVLDTNNDGLADVLAHDDSMYLERFAGQLGGSLAVPTRHFLGSFSRGFRTGDIDRDGDLEVVGVAAASSTTFGWQNWLMGNKTGFDPVVISDVNPYQIATGHFSSAQRLDFVNEVAGPSGSQIDLYSAGADGSYALLATTHPTQSLFSKMLEPVDRDGDGRDELLRAVHFQTLELYDPALPGPAVLAVPITEGIFDLQAADFDADGKEDFLVCGKVSGTVPIRFTTSSWFAQPVVQTSASGELAGIVALGQIDGLGAPDLVALHPSSGLLTWCAGNGDGTFQAPNPIGSVQQAFTVRLFDLDADGRLDVHVQTGQAGGTLFSFLQPGGTFAPTPVVIGCDTGYAIADIDLDGVDDLVTRGGWFAGMLVVRRGSGGAAGFAPIQQEVTFSPGFPAFTRVLGAHDYDGDGRQDLLLEAGKIGVMFHRSYLTPGTQPFGAGSAGCAGPNGWAALTQPVVGNSKFALRGDAAPANGVGLALLSAQADLAGSDPLQLGPLFHVGLGGVFFAGVKANSAGSATIGLPVPNDPTLVGVQLFTQVVWSWPSGPCVPTQPLGLSSSPGLTLTILP